MISEVRTAVDAMTKQARPDTNYGDITWMTLSAGADTRKAFIWFDEPFSLAADPTVAEALLYLYTKNAWTGGPHTLTLRRISTPWIESGAGGITYNDEPAVAGASVVVNVGSSIADDAELILDVTALLQQAAAGSAFYGIRVEVDTTSDKYLHSSDDEDDLFHPWLKVTWSSSPFPASSLRPGGARKVSIAQPTFTWEYSDADEGTQAAYKFQLDDASDFATPLVDTGWVTSADAQKILTEISLVDGTTYYWRVDVRDDAGLEAGWSDVATFSRDTKGTLTITNPSAGTPVVEETTPPINHTFTGETQAAVQHLLYQRTAVGELWELIHDSGRQSTTSLVYTLPEDLITSEDYTYKVVVRVWDTELRERTPGDLPYVEASREFTYDDAASSPTAVTTTDATTDDTPAVTVTWTRATAPDYFAIRYWRSGVSKRWAHTRLVPADVFVSGTTYRKKLWELDPSYTWTIEVQAVVLDGGVYKHSSGNPTDTANPQPTDAWLIVPGRDVYVPIYSPDPQDYSYRDDAETYYPKGAQKPVRLTNALGGVEGSISGQVGKPGSGAFGTSGKTYRETLENIRAWSARGEHVRLVHGDRSFQIILAGLTITPAPQTQNHLYDVTVEFLQAGNFPTRVR